MALLTLSNIGVLAVVLPLLYIYTAAVSQTRLPTLRSKRICLLIAHPDDEAMFFAPTVLALTRPENGNHVKILCLSSGNADGLGETRKKELVKSGLLLGLRDEKDILVYDSPDFPDSMTQTWDPSKIASLLSRAFLSPQTSSSSSDPPTATIDALITFDAGGISGHPNHISLYHGSRHFVSQLLRGRGGWSSPVDVYTLTSVSILRKYTGFLDVFATIFSQVWADRGKSGRGNPGALVSVSALAGGRESYGTARAAMTEAHKSQMVWFRWGWIALSRYMYVNDLRLERVKS
ncbi:LmbE-like protein [Hypomontagnella monticulosa]|nr:LmbE-like protein [Hypomontagnella monticulosa]